MFLFFRSQAGVGNRAGVLKGLTAAATAELINKVDTITDDSGTVKDSFSNLFLKYTKNCG
jgi:hypothetical protein